MSKFMHLLIVMVLGFVFSPTFAQEEGEREIHLEEVYVELHADNVSDEIIFSLIDQCGDASLVKKDGEWQCEVASIFQRVVTICNYKVSLEGKFVPRCTPPEFAGNKCRLGSTSGSCSIEANGGFH